jgi:glycogen phosphorylase
MDSTRSIAYFTMEIGLKNEIPTYSGGLGILAGDTVTSAADLGLPMVVVTLLYRKGYFTQSLDASGQQHESPVAWQVEDLLQKLETRIKVPAEGRAIHIAAWCYDVVGIGGARVPVIFLDTDLPENSADDRALTGQLYGGDAHYRFLQEVVLGIGGVRMLRALGFDRLHKFHMNEGHSSFLTLELLMESMQAAGRSEVLKEDIDAVRRMCVFTTHTPVPAGHDQFPLDLVDQTLGHHPAFEVPELCSRNGMVNMTYVALNLSRYINGVAQKHGAVSRAMFPTYKVNAITNGVHAARWTSRPIAELFDEYLTAWRSDNFNLRYAISIPLEAIWDRHMEAKRALLEHVRRVADVNLDPDVFTLGFARRMTGYKRPGLIFFDIDRLKDIATRHGRIQIIYAGKSHPRDETGKELIKNIFQARDYLKGAVEIAFLENYNMDLGALITSGVDVWLNTPKPPLEASGTSGMKAALNGVPSFSILDGWWIEGCVEGITGWAIGADNRGFEEAETRSADSNSLYEKLADIILPLYYKDREGFMHVMRRSIALNGSFFNTQRMLQEYVLQAYFLSSM